MQVTVGMWVMQVTGKVGIAGNSGRWVMQVTEVRWVMQV